MTDISERWPHRVTCSACRWSDTAYTAKHKAAIVKLGHKVNSDPRSPRCGGTVVDVGPVYDQPRQSPKEGQPAPFRVAFDMGDER